MAKVSIITGYYNRADALELTLESLRRQTYHDIEIVVFDDASSDNTQAVLDTLLERWKDDRFTIRRHQKNIGFVQGLIDAISATDSEYIAIQGSGDVSHETRIEKQVARLEQDPKIGMVGGQFTEVQENSSETRRVAMFPDANGISINDLIKRNIYFSHGDVMYRRISYESAGGYRSAFKYSQDYDLWLRIMRNDGVGTVCENLYDRYVRFDGVSYSPPKIIEQECYSILARRMAQMPWDEGLALYEELECCGPIALVSPDDSYLQTRVKQATLRAMEMQRSDDASWLIENYITRQPERAVFLAINRLARFERIHSILRMAKSSPVLRRLAFFVVKGRKRRYEQQHS